MTTITTRPAGPARGPDALPVRVPWATDFLLAVAMAFADGYWIVSLRGAVGAVEAGAQPFASWLRDSAAAVPAFAAVVLLGLTVALRRYGATPRRWAMVATFSIVVGAGTAAGVGWLGYQSAQAYVLQLADLHQMQAMGSVCDVGSCVERAESAILTLQLKAFAYGTGILLVTNTVVSLWVSAARGGRLDVAGAVRGAARPPAGNGSHVNPLVTPLTALLVGTAAVHGAVIPDHLVEWPAAGWFFIGLLSAETLAAGAVLVPPLARHRGTAACVALLSLGTLLLWIWSRTLGMPFGPAAWNPEPVGVADTAASVLELATAVLAVRWLHPSPTTRTTVIPHARQIALLTVVAVTFIGVAGTDLARPDSGAPPSMEAQA